MQSIFQCTNKRDLAKALSLELSDFKYKFNQTFIYKVLCMEPKIPNSFNERVLYIEGIVYYLTGQSHDYLIEEWDSLLEETTKQPKPFRGSQNYAPTRHLNTHNKRMAIFFPNEYELHRKQATIRTFENLRNQKFNSNKVKKHGIQAAYYR